MAIPSLADVKAKVSAEEIAPFEADIVAHLETPGTIEFLEDSAQPNRSVIRTYPGKVLSPQGIEALKASITAGGWTDAVVVNGFEPPRQGIGSSGAPRREMVTVSFKPVGSGGAPDPVDPGTGSGE